MNTKFILAILLAVLIGAVLLVCVCRLDMLYAKKHKYSFIAQYLLVVFFAGGVAAQALDTKTMPEAWIVSGLLAVLLNMLLTAGLWAGGDVPTRAVKDEYRPATPKRRRTDFTGRAFEHS